ncbi:MAG TPA: phosphate ABC transporter permease PstA [Fibrobacteria bacterium]|nr:phosphate ABC transporter permease PstA [Fibrobacteria bacterium]
MNFDTSSRRYAVDQMMVGLCWAAVALAAIPLVAVLYYVTSQGIHRFDLNFFTHVPAPVGVASGGMANSLVGTIELVLIASVVGIPVGILAGIYLAEFGKAGKFAWAVRFTADVLSGVPSIVTGIAAYTLIVRPMHHFSAWAGGVALGTMMIPMITRTTEELVKLVPRSVRESALALGIPEWKTILSVVVTTARNGILMGVLLSLSRIAGETAPLLFTAFNNNFWSASPNQPTASLTVQIFTYAISPFDDWHDQAWTGALTLLLLVVGVNLLARIFVKRTGRAVG